MKKLGFCLLIVGLLGLGGQAFAEIGALDAVPAATLLLPYFEVDLDAGGNHDTLFSINNASAAPALAHIVIWSDWSYPVIDFNVYLTGYDVQTFSLYQVIGLGNLPFTAHDNGDPSDTISPQGPFSQDSGFAGVPPAGCDGNLPYNLPNPVIANAGLLPRLQGGLTGGAVGGDGCLGQDYGDNVARGYITIDSANFCSLDFHNDPGYFANNGTGVANNLNQLWGDYFIVDGVNDFAQGETLVHVEAADDYPMNDPASVTGYTFYSRYTDTIADGTDNREPLGTTWATRYLSNVTFNGGTQLGVWRDSTETDLNDGATCGVGPAWYPMNETEVFAFDEAEDAVEICLPLINIPPISPPPDPGVDPTCFPLETGRYQVGVGELTIPSFDSGWLYLNLNHNYVANPFIDIAQSHVTANYSALGRFSVGLEAIVLTTGESSANPQITPALGGP